MFALLLKKVSSASNILLNELKNVSLLGKILTYINIIKIEDRTNIKDKINLLKEIKINKIIIFIKNPNNGGSPLILRKRIKIKIFSFILNNNSLSLSLKENFLEDKKITIIKSIILYSNKKRNQILLK